MRDYMSMDRSKRWWATADSLVRMLNMEEVKEKGAERRESAAYL
jgi:hypothetical protein